MCASDCFISCKRSENWKECCEKEIAVEHKISPLSSKCLSFNAVYLGARYQKDHDTPTLGNTGS